MDELITDLHEILRLTQAEEADNIRFRQFVKYGLTWSERRVDEVVLSVLREVEAAIDCTQCANCCRVLEISLEAEDLARLAAHLRRPVAEIEAEYAAPGTLCERAFAQSPCALLRDSRCTVYPARPRDCREYPHLSKGQFRERMWQVLSHAEDCPIVFNTLRRLKRVLRRALPPGIAGVPSNTF